MIGAQQSFAKGADLLTSYYLSLSRSTDQTETTSGSATMTIAFDVLAGTDTDDYNTDTWTVPVDGTYLINYAYTIGAGTPANALYIETYVDRNGTGGSAADSMKKSGYFMGATNLSISDTRMWLLEGGDTLVFKMTVQAQTGSNQFILRGASGIFAHVSILKIA